MLNKFDFKLAWKADPVMFTVDSVLIAILIALAVMVLIG